MLNINSLLKLASLTSVLCIMASAVDTQPASAQIPSNLPQQCRREIQSSINNFRRGRSVTVHTEVREAPEGHPSDRPQAVMFAFEGRAAGNVMASGQMLMATARRVIQSCPTVSAVLLGEWQTSVVSTVGIVNGNIQWFECFEEGEPDLGWGYEACGV